MVGLNGGPHTCILMYGYISDQMLMLFLKKILLQDALLKSNEVFETFKQEIQKVYLFSSII